MGVASSHHHHILDVRQLYSKVSTINDDFFEESNLTEGVKLVEEYPKFLLLVLLGDIGNTILLLNLVVELFDILHDRLETLLLFY